MWFLLAMTVAVFYASQSAWAKRIESDYDPDAVAWANVALAIPIYVGFAVYTGLPSPRPEFWGYMSVSLAGNLLAMPLFFRALKEGELSVVLPLSSLSPLFALGVEWGLLDTRPGAWAAVGVALIVLGAYLLNGATARAGLWEPILALARQRGARYAFASALIWSVTAVADRGSVQASSASFLLIVEAPLLTVCWLPWLLWRRRRALGRVLRHPVPVIPVILLGGGTAVFQMTAVGMAPAASVIAVKRTGVLLGVLLGGLLFQEKGLAWRLAAALLIVVGAAALAMG